MFRSFVYTIAVCVFSSLLPSCHGGRGDSFSAEGDTLVMRHAAHLTMVEHEGYTRVVIRNPWDTLKTLQTYLLVPDSLTTLPAGLPQGTVVRVPLSRTVVYTAVHCALLQELGRIESVIGVCDTQYMFCPAIKERCRAGVVANLGSGMSPNVERLIELSPDALLLSPFENNGGYGRVDRLGVPIVECADYMETSPLGRAEWVRFYGRLFGCAAQADSLFMAVEQSYQTWRQRALNCPERPTLFVDLPMTPSAWHQPGGQSTTGKLYADAGARFLFGDNDQSGSTAYSFETIFNRAGEADYWLIRYNAPHDKTYASLQQEYAPYARFRPFKEKRIYSCNTTHSLFYEEVPFHPDRLLRELACIFHPSLQDDTEERRYYLELK